jgi:hypothetical protein
LLAREAAGALASFGDDPAGLVTACRRLVDRQSTSGPIWWLCARVLGAVVDPIGEAWTAANDLEEDTTVDALIACLPDDAWVTVLGYPEQAGAALRRRGDAHVLVVDSAGEGTGLLRRLERANVDAEYVDEGRVGAAAANSDVVLLEAFALGPGGFIALAGSRAAAAVAKHAQVPVWVVAGVGRVLPDRLWQAIAKRLDDQDDPWAVDEEVVALDLVDLVIGPEGPTSPSEAIRRADCPVVPELLKEVV